MSQESAIATAKQAIGASPNIDWDTISYKIQPTVSEYLILRKPELLQKLSQAECGIIDNLEDSLTITLEQVFSAYRAKTQTEKHFSVSDVAAFLETRLAGQTNQEQTDAIEGISATALIKYVITTVQAYKQGIIPGSILPGKIAACQDPVSMLELQGSIMSMASQQVWQAPKTETNASMRNAYYKNNDGSSMQNVSGLLGGQSKLQDLWTADQKASIQMKASITEQLMSAGDFSRQHPSLEMDNQVTGGPLDLSEQFTNAAEGSVPLLKPVDEEILKHALSVMLACIRVRFDAIQYSGTELVPQEDIDHLSILLKLASYMEPNALAFFREAALTLQTTMALSHNMTKFADIVIPESVQQEAITRFEHEARIICQQITVLAADMQSTNEIFDQMIGCIMLAMTQSDRVQRQIDEKTMRRKALFAVLARY